jgi:general secretion pathway protein E/type IV pilus assembly protein PilB
VNLLETLIELAQESGSLDTEKCRSTLIEAAQHQRSLIASLLDEKLVEESTFLRNVSERFKIPWSSESSPSVPSNLREQFPAHIALRHQLLPFEQNDDSLYILTYDPFDFIAKQAVRQIVRKKLKWIMSTRRKILSGLRTGYGIGAEVFDQILEGRLDQEVLETLKQETTVLDSEDSEAAVVKFVNQILREALAERATDIHIEPLENDLQIRYRIDGLLQEVPVPAQIKHLQASVISRIKIMANLDIAERRLPQDGRINLEFEGRPVDVRVATIPSVAGETVSLRLLAQKQFSFETLGLDPDIENKVRQMLKLTNGIILITGPTGSGKSTTLYTLISEINTKDKRIVTVEDPVENKIPGVIQIAVKPEINLTFAAALRSILRGDPNVVMIGEMRDLETTEIAIRAALTGHLVFSTLHTNDAIGGITRLVDMGVEPFLVSASVRAFIAQRLIRTLCPYCKRQASHNISELEIISFPLENKEKIFRAVGCERCRGSGYHGRTAILELVILTQRLQDMISQRRPTADLRKVALEEGMITLRQAGFRKVIKGITTIEEVLRVTATDADVLDE